MKHIHTFESFLNEGTEIEIISMTDAGVSNTNRTESTKSHKDIEALLSNPDEWTDDISFKDKQGVVYFIDDLVGKNVKLGGKTILVKESHYAFLGGNSNFTDEEMRRNVVDKVLGKNYDAYIMFDDNAPKGEYDKMKAKYASDTSKWETIWRSSSYQSEARLSPDKKVIKAKVFGKGGIIGAIYVKK